MSNHLTDAQYAAFIDRLIACRDAEDAAKEDTKLVYAELAEAGEDKTAAGLIVRELRMTAKDRAKADFRDAAAEDGRARYQRGKASHVRAREASIPEHDPETGVIIEPETENGGIHETHGIANDPISSVAAANVPAVVNCDDDMAAGAGSSAGGGSAVSASDVEPVAPIHEPEAAMRPQTGAVETLVANSEAADLATVTVAETALVPRGAAASEPIADISKPNPICRDPDDCGVYASWHLPCEKCKAAAAHRSAA